MLPERSAPPRPTIDRATPDDLTSLVTDVGLAPMQVGAILLLDTPGGFDVAAACDAIAARVRSIPRLRQRLQPVPFGLGRPVWVDDGDFDIGRHLSAVETHRAGDLDSVLAVAADLVATRLPRDQPLWAGRFVPMGPDTTVLIIVFHHVLADGIGGLAVLAGLVDGASEAPTPSFPCPPPTTSQLASEAMRDRAHRAATLKTLPRRLNAAIRELGATGRTTASRSSLNRPTGPHRRLAVARCGLTSIHEVARAHGGSVNDVVLSAVAGALGTLVESRGEQVDAFVVSVPVSRRTTTTSAALGNQVGVAPIELPNLTDRRERLGMIIERGARIRNTPRGASMELLGPLFRTLARVRLFRWFVERQRLVNSFVTNLRGPDERLALLGAEITHVFPVAGISGNVTVAFAVLSYAGELAVTIITDPDSMPELDLLTEALQNELDAAAALDAPAS